MKYSVINPWRCNYWSIPDVDDVVQPNQSLTLMTFYSLINRWRWWRCTTWSVLDVDDIVEPDQSLTLMTYNLISPSLWWRCASEGYAHTHTVLVLTLCWISTRYAHCCSVRKKTYQRLQLLAKGVLSRVMKAVLSADPLSPVLTDRHLNALDRRVEHVLYEIEKCIIEHDSGSVLSVWIDLNSQWLVVATIRNPAGLELVPHE